MNEVINKLIFVVVSAVFHSFIQVKILNQRTELIHYEHDIFFQNVPQDLQETIVLIHVPIHVMEHSAMINAIVPFQRVIMSMDAVLLHSLQQVYTLVVGLK